MNPKTVHILLVEGFADWEASYAAAYIASPAFQKLPGRYALKTVAASGEPLRSMAGMRVLPDLTLDEFEPETSAMLILPGSEAWVREEQPAMMAKVREAVAAQVPVAAICGATFALARAGLLDTRPHTGPSREFLASSGYAGGAFYRDEPVVADADLITAPPTQAVAFADAIFARLDLYDEAVRHAWFKLFSTGDGRYFLELLAAANAHEVPGA